MAEQEPEPCAVPHPLPSVAAPPAVARRRSGRTAWLALAAVGLLGIVLVAVALTGAKSSATSGASEAVNPLGWARLDLRPVTQPAPVDGRFVLYTVDGLAVRIIALNARSGATVWSHAASTSYIASGEFPIVTIAHGLVIYLRPVGVKTARLVAVHAASGRTAWQGQPGAFTTWPYPCGGDPAVICTTGYMASAPFGVSYLRFDSRTGGLLPSPAVSPGTTGRLVGDGLLDPGSRQPEELLAVSGSSIAWSRTLASIFTLPTASTDWGWNFDRIPHLGLYVGSVHAQPVLYTRTRFESNLAGTMTAAFRVSDGSVIWRAPGVEYDCGLLPCPGADPSGWVDPASVQDEGTTVSVGLREVGTASGSPVDPTSARISPDAKATLYGFDPATGHVLWRFSAGHDLGLLRGLSAPPQTGLNTIVLRDSHGRLMALDLATGVRRAISPLASAWCRPLILYQQSIASSPYHMVDGSNYAGQPALDPCTAAGQGTAAPSHVPGFVAQLGARLADVTAWSEVTGVLAKPA